ncbi:MAG: hypothetical protein JST_000497 [Candidatus Parcubacteria bacterium]|jgi:hypothetical protein|nr:MAG: hypothetical protein JST_4640 [Candidatus Parcubacteria bacterium]
MKEEFIKILSIVSALGIAVAIIAYVISLFAPSAILDTISAVGFCLFILPMFGLIFALPAGLVADGEEFISFWGKVGLFSLFYLFLFPFITMLMVIATDAIFHFLPDIHEAMSSGADRLAVQEMRAEARSLSFIIGGIAYGAMILAGLIYRAFTKKAEA